MESFLDGKVGPGRALEVGKAAEHIVCADLILSGYRAFLADQGLPYDVIFDYGGHLYRVQVKSTTGPRSVPNRPGSGPCYLFHVRRAGKGAKRIIGNDEFDFLALVALDIRAVAYFKMDSRVLQTIHLRGPNAEKGHPNRKRNNIDEYPIRLALEGFAS